MILGVFLARKSYPWIKYLAVLLIVAGVAVFMYKDQKPGASDDHALGWGEILLVSMHLASCTKTKVGHSLSI